MGDVVYYIDMCDVLLFEQEYCLVFLFVEDCYQDIGFGYFVFVGILYVEYCMLQDVLEVQCWLGFVFVVVLWDQWCGGIDEFLQVVLQFVQVGIVCM